jgi:hypothetical protein
VMLPGDGRRSGAARPRGASRERSCLRAGLRDRIYAGDGSLRGGCGWGATALWRHDMGWRSTGKLARRSGIGPGAEGAEVFARPGPGRARPSGAARPRGASRERSCLRAGLRDHPRAASAWPRWRRCGRPGCRRSASRSRRAARCRPPGRRDRPGGGFRPARPGPRPALRRRPSPGSITGWGATALWRHDMGWRSTGKLARRSGIGPGAEG